MIEESSDREGQFTLDTTTEEYVLCIGDFTQGTKNGPIEQEIRIPKNRELLVMQLSLYDDLLSQIKFVKEYAVLDVCVRLIGKSVLITYGG